VPQEVKIRGLKTKIKNKLESLSSSSSLLLLGYFCRVKMAWCSKWASSTVTVHIK